MKKQWCIPPKANAGFVCRTEDVLDIYTRPYDPCYPVVCMDEKSKQLISETREPILGQPGQPTRYDYEYRREDVCNLFLFFEPLRAWRHVEVTDRRTKIDWAYAMKQLADIHFPDAERIVVVMDNLNTHSASSFYEAFEPAEAKRLAHRFEFHFTPKHGSWLNMAEIELSVIGRQCLSGRVPNITSLRSRLAAFENDRNNKSGKVDWRFTTEDARIKLKRLYPSIQH